MQGEMCEIILNAIKYSPIAIQLSTKAFSPEKAINIRRNPSIATEYDE
jgi:hypothetical protein